MSHLTRMIRFVRHWHARAGVLAALFFILLALTGLALNHTDVLELDKKQVGAGWLMRWYGLKAEIPRQGYLVADGYLVGDSHRWVMDGHPLPAASGPLVGMVEVGGVRYLATSAVLLVYQANGVLVDKMTGSTLPSAELQQIGKAGEQLIVQTPEGLFSTGDGLEWNPAKAPAVAWSRPQPLPQRIKAEVGAHFAPSLPLERILLDVHSGRIWGRHGPWVMDMAALVLVALSLSGVWIYLRSIRRRQAA